MSAPDAPAPEQATPPAVEQKLVLTYHDVERGTIGLAVPVALVKPFLERLVNNHNLRWEPEILYEMCLKLRKGCIEDGVKVPEALLP